MSRAFRLTAGVCLIYLAFLPPGDFSTDGNSMLAVTESLLDHFSVTVPENLGRLGNGGHYYSMWYPLLSLLFLPFAAAGHFLGSALHLPGHYLAAVLSLFVPILLTGMTASLVMGLARRLGGDGHGSWFAGVSFALGTIAMTYGRTLFADPLLAFCVTLAFYIAFEESPLRTAFLFLLSGLAILAKPAGIVLGPAIGFYLYLREGSAKKACLPLGGTAAGFLLHSFYNRYRFGSFLDFGQPSGFSFLHLPRGFLGLLFSPGRGIFWYSPPLIIGFAGFFFMLKEKKKERTALAFFAVSFLFLHALWLQWYGGWSWGSRLLLPLLPLGMAIAGSLKRKFKGALIFLTVMGFLINTPTLFSFYQFYFVEATQEGIGEDELLWSPKAAPLLHEWGAALRQTAQASHYDVKEVVKSAGAPDAGNEMFKVVAVWWWMAPLMGIPRWVGAMAAAITALLGLGLVWKARPPRLAGERPECAG